MDFTCCLMKIHVDDVMCQPNISHLKIAMPAGFFTFLRRRLLPVSVRPYRHFPRILLVSTMSTLPNMDNPSSTQLATFAAGCFWSVELVYQRLPGVLSTQVGYTGGHIDHPTYHQVCSGSTGHAESVRVEYDPEQVSYSHLLRVFFDKHDPTTLNRQGNDIGAQYRSAIFYHSPEQREEAQAAVALEEKQLGKTVVTQIVEAGPWWPAEEYHQQYLEKGGQCALKGCKDKIRCYG